MIAITDNETVDLVFDFYRTSQSGSQEKYYSVSLQGATLVGLNVNYPHAINHDNGQPEEVVSVQYRDITCQHHIAGTSGYSIWDDRVY